MPTRTAWDDISQLFAEGAEDGPAPRMEAPAEPLTPAVAAFDPGSKTAAVALMALDGRVLAALRVPMTTGKHKEIDGPALRALLAGWAAVHDIRLVVFEKVGTMPKQGISSAFNFGYGCGRLRGMIEAMGLPIQLVIPQDWKRVVLRGMKSDDKGDSVIAAKRLWPGVDLRGSESKQAQDSHNVADALCLAEYGRRQVTGSTGADLPRPKRRRGKLTK
jgi:crossover junction endodeoxyribonuclease RuvC